MKSIKDALTLYRTLAAEALSEFSYSQRGESLGRHLDNVAWRLSNKVRPSREPAPDYGVWQQMGYLTDEGGNFADLIARVEEESTDFARAYLDNIEGRLAVTMGDGSLYYGLVQKEAPLADQAERLREVYRPAFEQVAASLQHLEGMEWKSPVVETYPLPKFDVPSFADFDARGIEPWQEQVQDGINDTIRRMAAVRAAHEADFLADLEAATGFRLPLSDPADSVDDAPTT